MILLRQAAVVKVKGINDGVEGAAEEGVVAQQERCRASMVVIVVWVVVVTMVVEGLIWVDKIPVKSSLQGRVLMAVSF